MKLRILSLCATFALLSASAFAQYRTVIDKEAGSLFQRPNGFSYSSYGAFVGTPAGTLDPDALQVIMARFDKFSPHDATVTKGFPYNALKQYESQEVSAGRAPIFVTATYKGKKRPVYWAWSLKLSNNAPTTSSSLWEQAVNVQDPRFIKFWVNRFVRGILWPQFYNSRNVAFQVDEAAFNWNLFGVLDDSGHFVAGVPWDSPFPQSANAYFAAVGSFFTQMKTIAPEVKVFPNVGTMSDPSKFKTVFADVPGIINEDIYAWHANLSTYTRNNWYSQTMTYYPWVASQGKVQILRAVVPIGDFNSLLSAFAMYSLLKGPNSFFAPGSQSTSISPSQWMGMRSLLGDPIGTMKSVQYGSTAGYRLYSRVFQGGTVYLNFSGATRTITLDKRYLHWDPRGNQITTLTIPDNSGTFDTTVRPSTAVNAPRVVPRTTTRLSTPATVTLVGDTPNSTVYYTTDGSNPTRSSHVYSGPFPMSGNGTVKTRAYTSSGAASWYSNASVVTVSTPVVQFSKYSDNGPAGTYYPVLTLNGMAKNTVSVGYVVRQANGATTSGTATILAGQGGRHFAIPVSGPRNQATKITITSVNNASMGSPNTFTYTIQ
jgi:hypothetical protein